MLKRFGIDCKLIKPGDTQLQDLLVKDWLQPYEDLANKIRLLGPGLTKQMLEKFKLSTIRKYTMITKGLIYWLTIARKTRRMPS